MPLPDLLRLADVALGGHPGPQFPEDLVRVVVEESASRAGVLRRDGSVAARWPRTITPQVEAATEGWTDVPFGDADAPWRVRLLHPERLDEVVLGATRLALRVWDLREELRRTRFDERFHVWELEAIRAIATGIGGILEPTRLAEEIIGHLVALLGIRSAQLYLGEDATRAEPVGRFGERVFDQLQLEQNWDQGLVSDEVVALPLASESIRYGLLVAAHKEARAGTEAFASDDVRLLELFAVQVTVALEYVRLSRESLERERLRQELEVAAVIQSHLHPASFPDLGGWSLAARSSSSRQVAGDTYDVLARDDELVVTVTDVSGKGVGAGMIAAGVHAGVRLLIERGSDLGLLAEKLNRYLVGATADNRFATFAIFRLASDGSYHAVNAGHCPVLIRRHDGTIDQIDSVGLPLGILERGLYRVVSGRLEPGDLLVLYTDGVTEAEGPDDEEFGVERVAEVLTASGGADADAVCVNLLEAVDRFTSGRPLQDDATLVVVERLDV
jgi:serine phosphatase RsbU (regulator of sigma subunit)